jgi:hypothetical protein
LPSLCYDFLRLEVHVSELSGLSLGLRRDEDIALDMMKFIAGTTGYGKTTGAAAGFQAGAVNKAEDYAKHLLDLYGQCLTAVKGKK